MSYDEHRFIEVVQDTVLLEFARPGCKSQMKNSMHPHGKVAGPLSLRSGRLRG